MVTQRHYPNAPITEAILDFQVELPDGVTLTDLEQVYHGLEAKYPIKKSRNVAIVQGQVGGKAATAAASSRQLGFLFVSEDQKYVFQARLDGFTMSRLAPYERWEPFRDEAQGLWGAYRSAVAPTNISRLAMRYINRLDLPRPVDDLRTYLRTGPEVSSDLPQELAGYLLNLRIPQKDISSHILINQTIIESARPGVVSIVLDIDIFRSADVPQDEEGIWAFFESLREKRNDVFEACITDQARELFK